VFSYQRAKHAAEELAQEFGPLAGRFNATWIHCSLLGS
jgi:hypothetical protein